MSVPKFAVRTLLACLMGGLAVVPIEAQGIVTTPIGGGDDEAVALALQPDGKIVVAGFSHNGSNFDFAVVRYNADSSLDTSFDGDGKVTTPIGAADDRANGVAIQPDGKIVVAGFYWNGTSNAFAVVRYNSDGSLDTSFDTDGIATTDLGPGDDEGRALAIQPDGKIVAGGYMHNGTDYDFAVVRYNANGSLDTSFDTDGIVTTAVTAGDDKGEALALQSDGKILLAGDVLGGATNDYGVVRYNTNGSLDTSFDTDGIVTTDFLGNEDNPRFIALQTDGRILVGGSSSNGASFDLSLARYNANGSLDVSFDTDGKRTTDIAGGFDLGFGLDVQPDGKIVQAGWGHNGVDLDFAVVRYNSNGSLDTSFDLDGKVITPIGSGNDFGYRMAVESDGKIVVAGSTHNGTNLDVGLVRYCPNGSTQGSFSGTFAYRKAITIDETRVTGSSDLIDFPVLISVTDPQLATTAFGGNVEKGDGSDIVFTASCGGPRLAHEIEKYVDSTGELIAWVKVPLVRYNVDTVIFMYYGNPNVGCSTQNPSGVWDSSFKGVWHLKETPAGTPGEIRDSTANTNDGTGGGSALPSQLPGKIDGSLAFFGLNERHVLVPDNASLRLPTAVSLSAWVQTSDALVDNRVIALKWDNDPTKRNYWMGKIGTNLAFVVDDSQTVTALWTLVNDGTAHHVVGVADPAALLLRLYVDGAEVATAPYTGTTRTSTGDFRIGNSTEINQVFDGIIDEVQVSSEARPAGWIGTAFRNQNAPGTFYSFGAQQDCPCGLKVNYRSIGSNGGTLYNVGNASITVGTTTVNFGGGASLPSNVGVGDQLVIGAETFYILARMSAAQVTVQTAASSTHAAEAYAVTRAYTTLASWEAARQGNLAGEDRREVGVAYRDAAPFATGATIDGSTTDSCHFMWLTAAPGQRHTGVANTGATLDGNDTDQGIRVSDDYTVVEWLELKRNRGGVSAAGVVVQNAINVLLENLLIYDFADAANLVSGIRGGSNAEYTVRNSILYNGGRAGVRNNDATAVGLVENCTAYNMRDASTGTGFLRAAGSLTVTNSIAAFNDADFSGGITQSYNLSSDASATGTGSLASRTPTDNPAPGPGNWVIFANRTAASEDLHLQASVENDAVDAATDLSSKFATDVDGQSRLALVWDIGADELAAATAVTLSSFSARGGDGHVWLEWTTASELGNLGFHLYRAVSESGSYERITARPIPGLGSSPVGARYSYLDSGLANGSTYYYKLEDIETTGRTERHGPVSASPQTGVGGAEEGEGQPAEAPRLVTFGDPSANRLRVMSWSERGAVVELVTEGFTAEVLDDGTVRLEIPGFEPTSEPGFPSLPVTRPWLKAVGGRGVRLSSVREYGIERFATLRPSGVESPETEADASGTVRVRRGRPLDWAGRIPKAGFFPEDTARLLGTGFQGEVKKFQLEVAPVRWDGSRQELVLSRRVLVRLSFAGQIARESRTRVAPPRRASQSTRNVLIRLATRDTGLYSVRYEEVFPRSRRGSVASSALRLSRLGEAVSFHVEPDLSRFGPGSTLYFLSEGAGANPYGNEAVYELSSGEGRAMSLAAAVPSGEDIPYYWKRVEHEVNRFYQAALVDAPDLWVWDILLSPVAKSYPFEVQGLAPSAEPSRLHVWLQGASDYITAPDHHLRVAVNGTPVAELSWNGKTARTVEAELPPGVLREGENRLELENVGDTGAAYSLVFLDRFAVDYPRVAAVESGRLEGIWSVSGTASVSGLASPAFVLDVTEPSHPVWLTAPLSPPGTVRFRAEAGRRYAVVAEGSVRRPELRRPEPSRLKDARIGVEYLVVGPRAFLDDVEPLLELRRSQGLTTRTVAMENVYEEFGFGETRPEALREFLEYAYHRWSQPTLRYVLLLGDATYDFKGYLGTGVVNRVPPLMVKTSYLWTASDPTLAAVNGDDFLPDFAIGRLPVASEEELRTLVEKILAYENEGFGPTTSKVVLVADNPDKAGDFVADAEEIAGVLPAGRPVEKLYLTALGSSGMRSGITAAFDAGASVVSYIGHGGIQLWAHENVFNTADVPLLTPQAQQPLLITMNCLNGYFQFPYFNSLSEELLKADARGAIAAFSPTGMSLNAPAHHFHKAILDALLVQGHQRLGDAVLAGQAEYAASGAFPELLKIYHLLGDPALTLR